MSLVLLFLVVHCPLLLEMIITVNQDLQILQPQDYIVLVFNTNDPLWDGSGCVDSNTNCCTDVNIAWVTFYRAFAIAQQDDIEVRINYVLINPFLMKLLQWISYSCLLLYSNSTDNFYLWPHTHNYM